MKTTLTCLCLILSLCWLGACAPKFIPDDLARLKDPRDLGLASQRAYQQAKAAPEKKEKLKYSHAGILYSEKCLKTSPERPLCLYYNVLNRGTYIQNRVVNYQTALKKMIKNCQILIEVDPVYEHGGCYRILGDIYAKAPGFSLDPNNITRDLDQSAEYLKSAVTVSPDYPLNRLFYARTLEKLGEMDQARKQLAEFDRLQTPDLDKEYPGWKKEREELAQKLQPNDA